MKSVQYFLLPLTLIIQAPIIKASEISYCKFDGDLIFICDNTLYRQNNCEYYRNRQIYGLQFSENCKMTELPSLNLESFYNLHISKVNITSMGLKKLDKTFFSELKIQFNLFASHNQLNGLPDGIFESKQIELIDFSHNYFTEIEAIGRSGVEDLYKLDLSSNNITHIRPDSFVNLTKLDELNLSDNHITLLSDSNVLQVSVFDHLKGLKILDLSQNDLIQIEFGMFVHLRNLNKLNVSENYIQKMDISHLPPMNVQILDLSGNQFDEIEGSLKYVFHLLHELDLRDNNFNCSHLKSFLDEFDARNLMLDSSSKLMPKKSYRGIACRPSIADILKPMTHQVNEPKPMTHQVTESSKIDEPKPMEKENENISDPCSENHGSTETYNNYYLIFLILLLMTIVTGRLLFVYRKELSAKFHQRYDIRFRRVDADTISNHPFDDIK